MPHQETTPASLVFFWEAVLRRWFIALVCFTAVLALTVCVILFSTRSYRSTARLLLRIGHENAALDATAAMTGETIAPLQTREDEMETALGVMHSRMILEGVVDQLGIEMILSEMPADDGEAGSSSSGGILSGIKSAVKSIDPISDRESAIRALEQGLDISAPSKSSVFTIEYEAKHPQVATDIVNAWIENYRKQHSQVHKTEGALDFFQARDAELKMELAAAREALQDAKNGGGFATLEGHQKNLETQWEVVRSERLKTEAELVQATAQIDSFSELLLSAVKATMTEEVTGIANEAHSEMRALLFQLEVTENDYAAKYKDSHPKLLAIREQLSRARKILQTQDTDRKELRQTANPTHQQLSENRLTQIATREALESKLETLQQQQAQLDHEIESLNSHEAKLAMLTRESEVLEERYKTHAILLEQARLDDVLAQKEISSMNVIQPASFEERPVAPNKKLCAAAGMFAAILFSIAVPVLLELKRYHWRERSGLAIDLPPMSSVTSGAEPPIGVESSAHASTVAPSQPR